MLWIIKILIVLIPTLIGFRERKRLEKWYLYPMVLFLFLSVISEWCEHTSKGDADRQISQLSKTGSMDSARINSLLQYDTALTLSNKELNAKSIAILTMDKEIQTTVDNINLSLAKNGMEYNPITKQIHITNIEQFNVLVNKVIGNKPKDITQVQNVKKSVQDPERQDKLSHLKSQVKDYDTMVSNDKTSLKAANNSLHLFQSDKQYAINTAYNKLAVDSLKRESLRDSVKKYQN